MNGFQLMADSYRKAVEKGLISKEEERERTFCTECKAEGYIREKKLGRPKKDEIFKVVEEACEIGMDVAWRKGIKCLKCGAFTPFWEGDDWEDDD